MAARRKKKWVTKVIFDMKEFYTVRTPTCTPLRLGQLVQLVQEPNS